MEKDLWVLHTKIKLRGINWRRDFQWRILKKLLNQWFMKNIQLRLKNPFSKRWNASHLDATQNWREFSISRSKRRGSLSINLQIEIMRKMSSSFLTNSRGSNPLKWTRRRWIAKLIMIEYTWALGRMRSQQGHDLTFDLKF